MTREIRGIWAPMPTPLSRDGRVDETTLRSLVDFLLNNGVDGLFPLGTCGEFALLTREERMKVLEVVVDQANGKVPVFAGVSDPSTENVIRLCRDAKDVGADWVVATPPYYYVTTERGLLQHYRSIAGGTDLPLLIYNIPGWTHLLVSPEAAATLVEEGTAAGMKYTEENVTNLLRFITEVGEPYGVPVFTGSDSLALVALEFGGAGAIMGSANVAPAVASRIFDDYSSGDLDSARSAQLELLPVVRAIEVGDFPAGLKETMRLVGMPVGGVKPPLSELSKEQLEKVKGYLRQWRQVGRSEVRSRH